jgi:hypothetical protein
MNTPVYQGNYKGWEYIVYSYEGKENYFGVAFKKDHDNITALNFYKIEDVIASLHNMIELKEIK